MVTEYQGIPVFYTSSGEGNTLVLLHGFLETSRIWQPYLNQISLNRQVICIDLPGHGKTGIFGEVHTMELMADVVNAVLTELNISRVTILGHSMGGYVSLAFAEKYPEKISGIVLLNSTPEADSEEKRINRDKAARLVSKNKMAYINLAIENLVAPGNDIIYKEELDTLKAEAQKFLPQGIIANLNGMKIRTERKHILKELQSKKLIISGIDDPIMPVKAIESLAELCHCPIITIKGGHLSYIENKEQLREIMYFID